MQLHFGDAVSRLCGRFLLITLSQLISTTLARAVVENGVYTKVSVHIDEGAPGENCPEVLDSLEVSRQVFILALGSLPAERKF